MSRTVMIIDDDFEDQMILKTVVEDTGEPFEYTCMDTAEMALNSLTSNTDRKPDIIFLDLNLPVMQGMDCLSFIKQQPSLNGIPVIIYSTSSREKDIVMAKELGAFSYLNKPSSYIELKQRVSELFASLS